MAACRVANVKATEVGGLSVEFVFEIEVDVAEDLVEDAVFRCIYIVDPAHPSSDVELLSVDVGSGPGLARGIQRFTLPVPPPPRSAVEASGAPVDVAGLVLSANYRGSEFCRVGYVVRYECDDPKLQEFPPEVVDWSRLRRVFSDPRVTRFPSAWDKPASELEPPAAEGLEGAEVAAGERGVEDDSVAFGALAAGGAVAPCARGGDGDGDASGRHEGAGGERDRSRSPVPM